MFPADGDERSGLQFFERVRRGLAVDAEAIGDVLRRKAVHLVRIVDKYVKDALFAFKPTSDGFRDNLRAAKRGVMFYRSLPRRTLQFRSSFPNAR